MSSATVERPAAATSAEGSRPLLRWMLGRILGGLGVLVFLSAVVFTATNAIPGSIVDALLGTDATPSARAQLETRLGLDDPFFERYLTWAAHLLSGDFGHSLADDSAIGPQLWSAAGHSLILAAVASVVTIPVSIALGTLAGLKPGSGPVKVVNGLSFLLLCVPEFVLGMFLVLLFAVWIPAFPAISGVDGGSSMAEWAAALVLPALTVIPGSVAFLIRVLRFQVADTNREDFIRMAPLRVGYSRRRTIGRHVLPNTLAPTASAMALNLVHVVTGLAVVETLFQYPGLGMLLYNSIGLHDIPVVQACALAIGAIVIVLNIVADLIARLLDPRVGTLEQAR
ncbi:ABC transporter permease [Actinomadura graeca]|uniref:ABC transporter permease n=1 Tax=Actinomadura graeca TaxID=2750812 RepID=A0ABX8R140_9ACTN|nr:ABC transporter permease [Actinomadura graeca]QXJ24266.1 ABC transporter permease [Actinomadura graeca]